MFKPDPIIILGPTGVGKTALVLEMAGQLPIEIINADSMQFYRFMDIGTSKPSAEEQAAVPHHLFSIVDPDGSFDAARFMEAGRKALDDIALRGQIPVVVGGTGLYIKALTQGLFPAPEPDADLRVWLRGHSKSELYEQLSTVDPEASRRINPQDAVRMIRALEVFYLTGIPLSRHHQMHLFQDAPYRCLKICLVRERQGLYRRIEQRVDRMMEQGLVEEVQALLRMGYTPQLRPMQAIGYRQIVGFMEGRISRDEAVRQIKTETKRLAKRQLTWFRKDPELTWVALPEQAAEVRVLIKKFLNNR